MHACMLHVHIKWEYCLILRNFHMIYVTNDISQHSNVLHINEQSWYLTDFHVENIRLWNIVFEPFLQLIKNCVNKTQCLSMVTFSLFWPFQCKRQQTVDKTFFLNLWKLPLTNERQFIIHEYLFDPIRILSGFGKNYVSNVIRSDFEFTNKMVQFSLWINRQAIS